MIIFHSLEEVQDIGPTVIALGNFDGVHIGHQELIRRAVNTAKNNHMKCGVFTFSNHPRNVVKGKPTVKNIVSLEDKHKFIQELGVDYIFSLPFDETIQHMTPEQYIDEILLAKFNMKEAFCGFNYRYGLNAAGDVKFLIEEGSMKGYTTHVLKPVQVDGVVISSTLIRNLIKAGDMQLAEKYLGRYYSVRGTVVQGNRLGRTIGFPTSNILIDDTMVVPCHGVYVTRCTYKEKQYGSVTNVGIRPTIGDYVKSVETHIFDFNFDIYGREITVEFIDMIREEIKFPSVEDLTKQIAKDSKTAKEYHKQLK